MAEVSSMIKSSLLTRDFASTASLAFLEEFAKEVDASVWLTGSTLLASILGKRYSGDLDIIASASSSNVERHLARAGLVATPTFMGAIRTTISDGTQIDIVSGAKFKDRGELSRHLALFDFSCVSQALELDSGQIISTGQLAAACSVDCFKINSNYIRTPLDTFPIVRRFSVFKNFFGLSCLDEQTLQYEAGLRNTLASSNLLGGGVQVLAAIAEQINLLLGGNLKFALCRGIVRNAHMGRVSIFDDWDVLVWSSTADLEAHFRENGLSFVTNFFGMPKLRTENGQKIDFICLNGRTLDEVLCSFIHNCDRIAWSPETQRFVCPYGEMAELSERKLTIREEVFEGGVGLANFYYLQKSIFYSLQYGFSLPDAVRVLSSQPSQFSRDHLKSACRLAIELCCRDDTRGIGGSFSGLMDAPRSSAAETIVRFLPIGEQS